MWKCPAKQLLHLWIKGQLKDVKYNPSNTLQQTRSVHIRVDYWIGHSRIHFWWHDSHHSFPLDLFCAEAELWSNFEGQGSFWKDLPIQMGHNWNFEFESFEFLYVSAQMSGNLHVD